MTQIRDKASYIPALDGLRAIAILIVIALHCVDRQTFPALAMTGMAGVVIFFALSGYLITTRLLAEYESSDRIDLRAFYLRRAFRILPAAVVYGPGNPGGRAGVVSSRPCSKAPPSASDTLHRQIVVQPIYLAAVIPRRAWPSLAATVRACCRLWLCISELRIYRAAVYALRTPACDCGARGRRYRGSLSRMGLR